MTHKALSGRGHNTSIDKIGDILYSSDMARLARLVIPGLPHHVTQRGNRRQQTFFNDGDYAAYLELMADWCREEGVEIWGYCLMPNHVHLIAVPQDRRRLATGHRRGPSTLHAADQFPREMARLPVARALRFLRHGRAVPAGGRAVRGVESRAGETGRGGRTVAVEQCEGPPVRPRRPLGESRTAAGDGRRLARLSGQCDDAKELEDLREHGRTGRRLEVRRFSTVWKARSAVSCDRRKAAVHQNYAKYHN